MREVITRAVVAAAVVALFPSATQAAGWEALPIKDSGGYVALTVVGHDGLAIGFPMGGCDRPFVRLVGPNGGLRNGEIYPLEFRVDEGTLWSVAPKVFTDGDMVKLSWDVDPKFITEASSGNTLRIRHGGGISVFNLAGSRNALSFAAMSCSAASAEHERFFHQEPAETGSVLPDADARYFDL